MRVLGTFRNSLLAAMALGSLLAAAIGILIAPTGFPWVTGAAFAVVIAVVYIACAAAVLLIPDAFLTFANNWAHGIDLTLIRRPASKPLSLNDWGAGFATAIAAGFLAGAIYGWARNFFARLGGSER